MAHTVLGLNIGFHDGSACLVRNGRLLHFVEQERVSRRKHALAEFPERAVRRCLEVTGVPAEDVDEVAIGWDFRGTKVGHRERFSERRLLDRLFGRDGRRPPVRWVDHHLAHAASALYPCGELDAAVLVADGAGERVATSLMRAENGVIEPFEQYPVSQSLGFLYSSATRWAGFGGWGPGKLMGLAAYGRPRCDLPITVGERGYTIEVDGAPLTDIGEPRGPMLNHFPGFEEAVAPTFASCYPFHPRDAEPEIAYADFASSVQAALEESMLVLARNLRETTGSSTLVLAGGVAMNCSMVGRLVRSGLFDRVYVPPVPIDAGVALGAALLASFERGHPPTEVMDHAHWSDELGDDDAAFAVSRARLAGARVRPDRLGAAVAELLERGAVVGWATGRAEIGERALGGRSLLADPRRRESLVRLNRIKGREMWRPVAPSVQAEHLDEVLSTPVGDPGNFMLAAGFLRGAARRTMPAVTHVDGSARPQRVNRSTNPAYWSVIDEFRRRTGVPAVVNTSFNLAGEPMVRTAQDAVGTYIRAEDIDYLVLGRTVVARSREALTRWSDEISTGAA